MANKIRLAIVVSHPIQYHSPWFAHLATIDALELKVFYLWDFGVSGHTDRGFGVVVQWDIPLLEGYNHEFVPNVSRDPGTHHFLGLNNPVLVRELHAWTPDCILLFGFNYISHQRVLWSRRLRNVPIILRGDSHNLGRSRNIKAKILKLLRCLIFSRCSAFLAVGKANVDYYRSHIGRPIFMAEHFVDNARFRAGLRLDGAPSLLRQSLGITPDVVIFGFVGKFEGRKAPMDIIFASNDFSRMRNDRAVAFVFVGSGELDAKLKEAAADRLNVDVFILPFQNQSSMPAVYGMLDFLILPSAQPETWGLCVNEAMSCGVIPIVSDVVGCAPDLVSKGETGLVFKSGVVSSLRDAINWASMLEDAERLRLANACKNRVEHYSVENASMGLLRAVSSLIG